MRAAVALSLCVFAGMLACAAPGGEPSANTPADAPASPEAGSGERRRGGAAEAPPPPVDGDVTVRVLPDGGFDPPVVSVKAGATVTWTLAEPRRDSVVPLADGEARCDAVAPYRGGPDDFTGPMLRRPSGLFVLNADGPGLVADGGKLTESGPFGAVMDSSWESPVFTGASLRLRWNVLQPEPGRYDWSTLDAQLDKAVAEGKLYTVAVKAGHHGTPDWIFDSGVDRLVFREFGSGDGAEDCKCGAFMALGNPTQPRYQELYFAMLDALAEHLKSNAAWYRNLAYVKSSGANLYSGENRLPKRCECAAECAVEDRECKVPKEWKGSPHLTEDGRICNTRVWAEAGYTPDGIYAFYRKQHERLASAFPDKDLMYMLIHDGFPRVASKDRYLECGQTKKVDGLPDPTEQTRTIVRDGWRAHGDRFALMHAGLNDQREVNKLLRDELQRGQTAALQTTNDVLDAARMRKVLEHALEYPNVGMVEIYDEAAYDVARASGFPDFDARLRANGGGDLPSRHAHTFRAGGTYRYVNPRGCAGPEDVGVVHVTP